MEENLLFGLSYEFYFALVQLSLLMMLILKLLLGGLCGANLPIPVRPVLLRTTYCALRESGIDLLIFAQKHYSSSLERLAIMCCS